MNKKIALARARSETTIDNFNSAAQGKCFQSGDSKCLRDFGNSPHPTPADLQFSPVPRNPKYTPKEENPRAEETRERGVGGRGGCVSKMSAQTRKVGGGREQAAPGGGRGHFATPNRLPQGLAFQSLEPGERGWGKKKK